MPNCKNCGAPLTKGNIRVVRPRGKKRPFRIHRRCPERNAFLLPPPQAFIDEVEPKPTFTGEPDHGETHSWKGNTAGSPLQRPQDSTGDPVTVEGVLDYPTPPKYRYFITRATAERLQRAVEGRKVGISLEVFFVPDYEVEANPEALAGYVEIEFKLTTD